MQAGQADSRRSQAAHVVEAPVEGGELGGNGLRQQPLRVQVHILLPVGGRHCNLCAASRLSGQLGRRPRQPAPAMPASVILTVGPAAGQETVQGQCGTGRTPC